MGLYKSKIFAQPKIAESIGQLPEISYQSQLDNEKPAQKTEKYEKSGLDKEKASMYMDLLMRNMEEKKPYINPDLTLGQLAEMLSMSPHNLSEVLNTHLHQNFFDFINKFRVEMVKKDLVDPEKKNLKLFSIALDAGFNSKSSFNSIFKKLTGQTPSEYKKNNVGPLSPDA
jgi:AraC-like DNA-binding protein